MQRLRFAAAGALLMLATIGVGAASADPVNTHSRYFTVNCAGEVLDFVTTNGASGHVLGDMRTVVLKGFTVDGVWAMAPSNGQTKADLVACAQTDLFEGHQYVFYFAITPG